MSLIELWIPPLLWAGIIAVASTGRFSCTRTFEFFVKPVRSLWPHVAKPKMQRVHVFVRKAAHWTGYFILTLLLARAVQHPSGDGSEAAQLGWIFLVVALMATIDELHQTTVPNRQGTVTDVLIDLFGSGCAILLLAISTEFR